MNSYKSYLGDVVGDRAITDGAILAAAIVYLADTLRENAEATLKTFPPLDRLIQGAAGLQVASPQVQPAALPLSTPSPESPQSSTPGTPVGGGSEGPTDEALRAALLTAIRRGGKAQVIGSTGVLIRVAGVDRLPDCPPEKRQALLDALVAVDEIPF